MANTKWNNFPALTAQELDDADLLPLADMSKAIGQRDATISVGALRESLGATGFYDVQLALPGVPGAAEQAIALLPRSVLIKSGIPGVINLGTNPTATATLTIRRNTTSIGTIEISAGGAPTWTFSNDVTFNAADRLILEAPTPADASLADMIVTFRGEATL